MGLAVGVGSWELGLGIGVAAVVGAVGAAAKTAAAQQSGYPGNEVLKMGFESEWLDNRMYLDLGEGREEERRDRG